MKNIYDSLNGGSGNGNSPSSSGLGNSGPSGLNPAMTPAVAGNNIAKEMAKKLGSEAGEKALGAVGAAIDITDAVIGVAGAENSTEATIPLTDSIGGASAAAATYGMLGGGVVGATGSAIVGGLYGTGSYIGRTYVGSLVDGYYNRALAQVLTSTSSLSHRQELLKAWHRLGRQASEAATKINECCEGVWQG